LSLLHPFRPSCRCRRPWSHSSAPPAARFAPKQYVRIEPESEAAINKKRGRGKG
jgi:hypothetical protein